MRKNSAKKARREMKGLLVKVNRAGKAMMTLCINSRDKDTKRRACAIGHRLWRLRKHIEAEASIASLLK